MTRSSKAKYYSTQFFDLAEALSEDPERVVELEFETPAKARTFRLEFYSFRAAAEREGLVEGLYSELAALTVRVSENKVTIMHKDYTPSARALRKALGK